MKALAILMILQANPIHQGPLYLPNGWETMLAPGQEAKRLDPDCVYRNESDHVVIVRLEITGDTCRYVIVEIK